MFAITKNKGFHITFENGINVSVQFGGGNYCDNYDWKIAKHTCIIAPPSSNAEVMIWRYENGKMDDKVGLNLLPFSLSDNSVKGWCTPEELVEILNKVVKYNPNEH